MFDLGDYVVCPGHGVGQVSNVEEKDLGGETKSYYTIKIISNGMTVMVPVDSETGARSLVGIEEVDKVYELLNNHNVEVDNSTWNRRYRDYMTKIKTGSLIEIADVLRSLFLLRSKKNLSFGEKKMLEQCKDLIAQEISISNGVESTQVKSRIDSCFQ